MKKILLLVMGMALITAPVHSRDSAGDDHSGIVLGGVLGNFAGAAAGGLLGSGIRDRSESLLHAGMAVGILAGSVCGSALGVHLAAGGRGDFGRALLGSLLGEVSAIAVSSVLGSGDSLAALAIVPFAILPPAGAALFYRRSMAAGNSRAGGGIFNLAAGKFGFGVPDVQVRPLSAPGLDAKPELQFKVRVLTVKL